MSEELLSQISELDETIKDLTEQINSAKDSVRRWTDASKDLGQQAATERAKNQGAGRGFLGGLFGSKYRSIVRASAAASNASISQEVAKRRSALMDGKRAAQEHLRSLQDDLRQAKEELKDLKLALKASAPIKGDKVKSAHASLDLLAKLKEAHNAGLLTDAEYEQKRVKLLDHL